MTNKNELKDLISQLIDHLGIKPYLTDPNRTAISVSETFKEIFDGINHEPAKLFEDHVEPDSGKQGQLIILKAISFHSICEHHFLPFFGYVDICYIPNERIVGIGRLTKLVKILMRRPQLQENFTSQLVKFLDEGLLPKGLGVHVIGTHFCETMRGTKEISQIFQTIEFKGELKTNHDAQNAFLLQLTKKTYKM